MARRPAHTFIFLGAHRTDRVDFDAAPTFAALGQHHQVWQGSDDLVSRVDALIASTPQLGKLVWVLWEGAGAQILEMPAAVVNGLEPAQLADALSFEAEPLTGIAAGDSAIDGIPQRNAPGALAEFRRFWVTQISAAVRVKLDEAIARAGAKLGGIVHPGGLPRDRWDSVGDSQVTGEWRRVEVWDQLTFSLHGRTDGTVETRVIRSSPGSEGWVAELPTEGPLSWMGPGPVSRVSPGGQRVSDARVPLDADGIPLEPAKVDLPVDAPVEWLRAWAGELTATPRRVPVVASSSQVSPNRKFYLVGGLSAALALAICTVHGGILTSKAGDLRALAARREAMRAQMAPADTTRKEETAINSETQKLVSALKDLDQTKATRESEWSKAEAVAVEAAKRKAHLDELRARHRPALGELLSAVADSEQNDKVDQIIVKEIRQEANGDLRLTGLCKQSSYADAFATRFENRLNNAGWRVGAAQKQRRADGAFDFAVVLTPVVLLDSGIDATEDSPLRPTTAPTIADAQRAIEPASTPNKGVRQQ